MIVGAESFVLPDHGLHADEIDNALEIGFRADRQLDRNRACAQALLDVVDALLEGSAGLVHLVAEHDARNLVLVALAPNRLGLRLNALVRIEHANRAVEHAQASARLRW